MATSSCALSVTMAAFLASKPSMALSRLTLGCIFLSLSATLDEPIKVKTSILPDSINCGMMLFPLPYKVLITPAGNESLKASNNG